MISLHDMVLLGKTLTLFGTIMIIMSRVLIHREFLKNLPEGAEVIRKGYSKQQYIFFLSLVFIISGYIIEMTGLGYFHF